MGVKINRRYFELDFYHKKEFFIILYSCHMKFIRKNKTKLLCNVRYQDRSYPCKEIMINQRRHEGSSGVLVMLPLDLSAG